MSVQVAPGVILAVHGGGLAGTVIRLGEIIAGKPWPSGHVAVVTHQDKTGRWMGIEGRPGGVGLADLAPYIGNRFTRSNYDQPRPDDKGQLNTFLGGCAKSLGIQYDWLGIAADTALALHAPDLAADIEKLYRWPAKHDLMPGHVVCSSLAAMLYDLPEVGWAHPFLGDERVCMPADWWQWNDERTWEMAPPAA